MEITSNFKACLTVVAAIALSACNSDGGDNSTGTVTITTPPTTAEGFWSGTTSNGTYSVKTALAILENGETWGIYTSGNVLAGAFYGNTSSTNTTLSASGLDFNFSSHKVYPLTFSGAYIAKTSLNATMSEGSKFIGTYGTSYDTPASLPILAGSFSGFGVTGATPAQTADVGISSLGAITSVGNNCSADGTVTPRASGKNVFDVSVKFTGTNCALGNGTTATGNAYYDTEIRQIVVLALNPAKTDGFIYIGTKH